MGDLNEDFGFYGIMEADPARYLVWECRDGRRVAIVNMTDTHLLNTIRCLRGLSPRGTKFSGEFD